jgi:hypothetical protein
MFKTLSISNLFKSNQTPISPISILTGIIIVFVYYKAYEYLDGLRSCNCAPNDLSTLKNLEMFFIVISALYVILNTIKYVSNNTQIIPQGIDTIINAIYIFFLLVIEVVYIYNVYTYIYNTDDCKCMDHWQKYILYYQSIIYSIMPIFIIILLFVFGYGPSLAFLIILASLVYYAVQQISQTANLKST